MLSKAGGYLSTEVSRESPEERRYRVRDFWSWHRNFESFRTRFQSDFERFEQWIISDRLVEREQFVGAYYEEFGGEDDLVLS
jgi:hypothetical protein